MPRSVNVCPKNRVRYKLVRLTEAYQLIHQANDTLERLMELTTGVASALGSSQSHRQVLVNNLKLTLEKLKTRLSSVVGEVGAAATP